MPDARREGTPSLEREKTEHRTAYHDFPVSRGGFHSCLPPFPHWSCPVGAGAVLKGEGNGREASHPHAFEILGSHECSLRADTSEGSNTGHEEEQKLRDRQQ